MSLNSFFYNSRDNTFIRVVKYRWGKKIFWFFNQYHHLSWCKWYKTGSPLL